MTGPNRHNTATAVYQVLDIDFIMLASSYFPIPPLFTSANGASIAGLTKTSINPNLPPIALVECALFCHPHLSHAHRRLSCVERQPRHAL